MIMEMKKNTPVKKLEEFLLFTGMLVLCCQVFGRLSSAGLNVLINVLWYVEAAGFFVLAGYRTAQYSRGSISRKEIMLYALKYYGLFVLAGIGRFVMVDKGEFWDDLIRVTAFISVPKYAEIFFTMTVLLLLSAFWGPFLFRILQKRHWALTAAFLGFLLIFLPQAAVRYPVFAIWMNSECYRCLPIPVYLGYYFAGMWLNKGVSIDRSIRRFAIPASVIYTVILLIWHRSALMKTMEFPLHYWEILLPAGLLFLFFEVSGSAWGEKVYAWIQCRIQRKSSANLIIIKTALMILMINALRGYFEVKKCPAWKVFLLFVVLWGVSSLCGLFLEALRRDSVTGWCRKHKKLTFVVLYSVGFAVMFVLVYLPFLENEISLIWRRDGISQYFPKAMLFSRNIREILANFLQGNFHIPSYTFNLGLGDSIPVKLEPLYWLHALFAPEDMEIGYEFVMILRMYLSGLSVSALLYYFKKDWKITWICSYIYCFSGYTLYACTRHAHLMVAYILLPLLVIAVEEILRKKKWYLGCVLIALSLLCSYYFLYMNTIVLALYFLIRYAFMPKENQTWKNFWSYVGCFAGAYILGVGMGSMTIFTSLFNYFGSGRAGSGTVAAESLLYYKKDWLNDVYMSLIAPGEGLGYWMKLGMIPLCLLAIVMLFLRKNKKELKAAMIFCLLGLPFPFFAYFMSGFGSVTNRWLYIFVLVMTLAVAEALAMIPSLTKRELSVLFLSILPYFVMAMFYSRYNTTFFLKALGMLLMTYIVIVFSTRVVGILSQRQMLAAMAVLVAAGLAVNGNMLFSIEGANLSNEYAAAGKALKEARSARIKACTAIEDDSFYRVSEAQTKYLNYCASAALGVNSVSYFSSTMNGLILEFDRLMGNGRSCMVYHCDFNNRTMLNALACVKYYGALNDEQAEFMLPYGYALYDEVQMDDYDYAIFRTEDTLPLAYSYDAVMSTEEMLEHPVEERQELMMKNAVIDSDVQLENTYDDSNSVVSGYEVEPTDVIYKDTVLEGDTLKVLKDGTVTFTVDPVPNAEMYILFKGNVKSTLNKDSITLGVTNALGEYPYELYQDNHIYYLDIDKNMINFGYHENGIDQLTIRFDDDCEIRIEDFAIYCQPMDDFEAELQSLKAAVLENITMENDSIRGTISADKNKLLVFSIPYQNGWTAWVDGKKADLIKTNIMYTGLEIGPGEHEIELHYEMPGVKYGILVTLVSAGIFVLVVIGNAVLRKRKVQRR